MSKFCKNCIYWVFSYQSGDRYMGTCSNDQVIDSIEKDEDCQPDETEDKIRNEAGVLHTEKYFGCVYHRSGTLNVTKIKGIEEIGKSMEDGIVDNIKIQAEKFIEELFPKILSKFCNVCNASNCINNLTCVGCNAQF